jgi:hypothetical protein
MTGLIFCQVWGFHLALHHFLGLVGGTVALR